MALTPPIAYGQRVTLSYRPSNATEATQVRDNAGNRARAFSGIAVRNDTLQDAHVDSVAFASEAQTYAIGDTIEIDVTFSEAVTVTGTPTLDLRLGDATATASYETGSGTTVLRFEYDVTDGDLDTVGATVARNGLKTPTGSSVTSTRATATS